MANYDKIKTGKSVTVCILHSIYGKGCGKRDIMKFKMINGSDIQCVVTEEEMRSYGLEVNDIFSNTQKAQYFLNEILDRVEEETGYFIGDGAKTVQAVCLPGNAVALTFSDSEEESVPEIISEKKIEVLRFQTITDAGLFCQKLNWEKYHTGILCKEKESFYLIVDLSECDMADTNHFLAVASEFAEDITEDEWKAAYLGEHAKVVIPEYALQALALL